MGGTEPDSNVEFLRCFGRQMKLLREVEGLTQVQLGELVGYGEALIAAVEQGRRIPKPELIDSVDHAVKGRGVLIAMKGEAAKAGYPSFFRRYAELEAEAEQLHAVRADGRARLIVAEAPAPWVRERGLPLAGSGGPGSVVQGGVTSPGCPGRPAGTSCRGGRTATSPR